MVAVDISPKNDRGVLKEIIKEGLGEEMPTQGCKVSVHYVGTLLDGTEFDSSRERNEPFVFELGKKDVIKSWDIVCSTMKKGEIAVVTCSPDYAYKAKGHPPKIPPYATLKFEIEMLGWVGTDVSPDKDGSIEKYQIEAGSGYLAPNEGSLVDVHIVGSYNGTVFDEREVQFTLGEGEDIDIIDGIEKGLPHFRPGEKSRLTIKSKYAFRETGSAKFNIPPYADVQYIVHLKTFEKAATTWSMSEEEVFEQAALYKEKGTAYFKEGKFGLATKLYNRIPPCFRDCRAEFKDEHETKKKEVLLSAHLNLALCYLKTDNCVEAKNSCKEALKLSPDNEKALFRRGQAHMGLAAPKEAIADFEQVLVLNPNNVAATNQIIAAKKLTKEILAKEKQVYANMFDRFALKDKQKEEEILRAQPDVMRGALGEWGQEERPGGRDPTAFEKENPNILMLNANGTGEFKNM